MDLKTTTAVRGTAGYRAPELLTQGQYSKAADIWALGCIVFELTTSLPAFANDYAVLQFNSAQEMSVQFVNGFSDVSEAVLRSEWLNATLQRDPQRRVSATSLADRIGSLLAVSTPSVADLNVTSWVSRDAMLGTDAPLSPHCLRWDDIFVPGTHQQHLETVSRCRRVWNTRETVLGKDHPASISSLYRFSRALYGADEMAEAQYYIEEIEKKRATVPTDWLPKKWATQFELAWSISRRRQSVNAILLLEEALKLRISELGPEHPKTLVCMNDLIWTQYLCGRKDNVINLLQDILRMITLSLGPDDVDTLYVQGEIARFYYEEGDFETALTWFAQALVAYERIDGYGTIWTAECMFNIARCNFALKRLDKNMHFDALETCERVLGPDADETLELEKIARNLE